MNTELAATKWKFPDGWKRSHLGDVATLQRGFDLPVQARTNGPFPVIGSNGIVGFHNESKVQGPGVVIGRSGTIGKSFYTAGAYWPLNTGLYVKDFHDNDPLFVHFFFHFFDFSLYSAGVSVPTLNRNLVHEATICIPSLLEQRAIAGVLAKIQAAVEVQEKIVATLKELKAATIAKLFRAGVRGEPLKQTEIGEIPEHWRVVQIGDYCEKTRYGHTETAHAEPIGPKFLRITDITENGVDWNSVPYCACPATVLDELRLKWGDLVFARIGATTGKSYLITDCPEAVFASYLIRLRAKPGLDPVYLSCFFESETYWRQIRANKGNNLKGGMSASVLENLLFPLPPPDEQQKIGTVLKAIERQIASAVKQRNMFKSLFSSMLHLLMTGQVRVTRRMIALRALAERIARKPKWSGTVDEKILQEVVRRIVEAAAPEKIILFGSAARGEMGPDSDLDLLIVKPCQDPHEVAQAIRRNLIGIGVPKDVVVVTPEDAERQKDIPGFVVRAALREGKVLYAA